MGPFHNYITRVHRRLQRPVNRSYFVCLHKSASMEFECGFELLPYLARNDTDQARWQCFIDEIKQVCQYDGEVEIKEDYIEFKLGDHPKLPMEGWKFCSFSSRMSGRSSTRIEGCISNIADRAQKHFGDQIRIWNEAKGKASFYHAMDKSVSIIRFMKVDDAVEQHEASKAIESSHDVTVTEFTDDSNLPLYEIRPLPDKGRGLIARFHIPIGTRILSEKPLLTVPIEVPLPNQRFMAPASVLPQARKILLERTLASKLLGLPRFDSISSSPLTATTRTMTLDTHSATSSRVTPSTAAPTRKPALSTQPFA